MTIAANTIFHVTFAAWDGAALTPLADQIEAGAVDLADAAERAARRWGWATPYAVGDMEREDWLEWAQDGASDFGRYLRLDGLEIHCLATIEEAAAFRAEFGGEGATILAIDAETLEVREGAEYPHPVIKGAIPAALVSVAA